MINKSRDSAEIRQENWELRDMLLCRGCKLLEGTFANISCGHLICSNCKVLTTCRLCRKEIKDVIRIQFWTNQVDPYKSTNIKALTWMNWVWIYSVLNALICFTYIKPFAVHVIDITVFWWGDEFEQFFLNRKILKWWYYKPQFENLSFTILRFLLTLSGA